MVRRVGCLPVLDRNPPLVRLRVAARGLGRPLNSAWVNLPFREAAISRLVAPVEGGA